jgi:hypothetical protein
MLKPFGDLSIGEEFNLPTSPYSSPITKRTFIKISGESASDINDNTFTITVHFGQFCKVKNA